MTSVRAMMYAAAGALIFCVAVSIFVMLVRNVDRLADDARDTSSYDTSLAREGRNEYSEPTVTYQDVMSELFTDRLEYDLVIDGYLIEKDTYNLALYEELPLFAEHSSYTRNCIYGTYGELVKVIYTGN